MIPRRPAVAGRGADGCLHTLSYLPKGIAELLDLNALIDEGAAEAGRDPRGLTSGRTARRSRPGPHLPCAPDQLWAPVGGQTWIGSRSLERLLGG